MHLFKYISQLILLFLTCKIAAEEAGQVAVDITGTVQQADPAPACSVSTGSSSGIDFDFGDFEPGQDGQSSSSIVLENCSGIRVSMTTADDDTFGDTRPEQSSSLQAVHTSSEDGVETELAIALSSDTAVFDEGGQEVTDDNQTIVVNADIETDTADLEDGLITSDDNQVIYVFFDSAQESQSS